MRVAIITLPLLLASVASASALDTFNPAKMTCPQLTEKMEIVGTAILRYPSSKVKGIMRFDRYVSAVRYCAPWQNAGGAKVKTSDGISCRVMRCFDKSRTMARF